MHFSFTFLLSSIVLNTRSSFQVLGETIHFTLEYLNHEAKAASAGSLVVALEVENSKLGKDLIAAMDDALENSPLPPPAGDDKTAA